MELIEPTFSHLLIIKVMRTRGNQLLIQILLMIIITVIVAYTCMNLAELVNMYSEAIGKAITQINAGF